jgi:hypothetical protein
MSTRAIMLGRISELAPTSRLALESRWMSLFCQVSRCRSGRHYLSITASGIFFRVKHYFLHFVALLALRIPVYLLSKFSNFLPCRYMELAFFAMASSLSSPSSAPLPAFPASPLLSDITALALSSNTSRVGHMITSEPFFNRLNDVAVRTISSNLMSVQSGFFVPSCQIVIPHPASLIHFSQTVQPVNALAMAATS